MPPIPFDVLYEDNHLLVVNKPAGVPTMGATSGKPSLLLALRQYIKQRYNKPGNVYLGIVSRLDSPVSGVIPFARTSKAAERLSRQFASGEPSKTYWAAVEVPPGQPRATLVDWLCHNDAKRRVFVTSRHVDGAKQARLSYQVLRTLAVGALLEVQLETGRKHQIRTQLSHHGMPIVGDVKYGANRTFPSGIALHCRRLEILHPVKRTELAFEAPLPDSWRSIGLSG